MTSHGVGLCTVEDLTAAFEPSAPGPQRTSRGASGGVLCRGNRGLLLNIPAFPGVGAAGRSTSNTEISEEYVVTGVRLTPPATRVEPVDEVFHGEHVPDPYRWLEDGGSPEVLAWTEAQNAYTRAVLEQTPGREAIREELRALLS